MTTHERNQSAITRHRFLGNFLGFVRDVQDAEGVLRIRAEVPRLGNMKTKWAYPKGIPKGTYNLPVIGQMVWIEFEGGSYKRPIWSYGPLTKEDAPQVTGYEQANTSYGRMQWLHHNSSGMVADGTKGNEGVFLRDSNDLNRMGVTSGREGAFVKSRTNFLVDVYGNKIEEIGGAEEKSIGGNQNVSVAGNSSEGIAGTKDELIGEDYFQSIGKTFYSQVGEEAIFEALNTLLKVVAGITIKKEATESGSVNIEIKTVSQKTGKITINASATGESQVEVNVTGDAKIDAKSIDLKGTPIIDPTRSLKGIVHGGTIEPFTGVPFGNLPTQGTPQGTSTSVKVTT